MPKFKGFVAACALLLAVSALLAGVCTGSARAGGVVFFIDAQHGWESTYNGDTGNPFTDRATAWHTVNGGASWKQQATGPTAFTGGWENGGFFAFATRSTGIWARAGNTVLRTTNAGASWHSVGWVAKTWLNDASFATSRIGWACSQVGSAASGGSIAKTSNAGLTWHVQKRITGHDGIGGFVQVSCPTASSCYMLGAGSRLGGLWATADGGRHWARRQLPSYVWWTSIDFSTATTGWAVGAYGSDGILAKTTNCGRTWRVYSAEGGMEPFRSISFCNSKVGYAVGSLGYAIRTTDGGASWTGVSGPFPYSEGDELTAVDCVDPTHAWIVDNYGSIYATSDGGNTWNLNSVYPPPSEGE